jgi:hypothetical protein
MSERTLVVKCLALVGIVLGGAWGCMNLQNGSGIILICALAIFALSDFRVDFR